MPLVFDYLLTLLFLGFCVVLLVICLCTVAHQFVQSYIVRHERQHHRRTDKPAATEPVDQ